MTKPSNFIQNSDYALLRNDAKGNDAKGQITLSIGDSGLLAFGQSKLYESFITLGTINASLRGQMQRSGSSDIWCSLGILVPVTVTVYQSGTPVDVFTYNLPVAIERSSATQIRMYGIFYSYGVGVDMRITGGYQTVTADIVTFLSPFN